MFIPFKINVDEIRKLQCPAPLTVINFEKREEVADLFLRSKLDVKTGTFDAASLKDGWLPVDANYHVFISYSHDDEGEAKMLVNYLESQGVRCFLDSIYWNNADNLLKAIDDAKCLNSDGKSYSYKKRNYSTSLVHAMLSMAIMEAIDKCDFGIFIESENSLQLNLDKIKSFTLSPWIYEELHFMTSIEKRTPSWLGDRQVRMFSSGSRMIVESAAPVKMRFEVPLDKLAELDANDLTIPLGCGETWLRSFVTRCGSELNRIQNN